MPEELADPVAVKLREETGYRRNRLGKLSFVALVIDNIGVLQGHRAEPIFFFTRDAYHVHMHTPLHLTNLAEVPELVEIANVIVNEEGRTEKLRKHPRDHGE